MQKSFKKVIAFMVIVGLVISLFAVVDKLPQKAEASA